MTDISKNAELQQSCITAVKSRFYAQYWGQNVGEYVGRNDATINMNTINQLKSLFLKPLSKATREEVFDTYCKMWEFNENLIETDTKIAIDWFQNYGKPHYVKFNQEQTDFLRSKGYAIPFMEYSVDDLISFGWVQLL